MSRPAPVAARVRAPELRGRSWLNTGGTSYSLGDFRGRFVLLDFWTFCCVNCLHVIEELRPVEEGHREELVVVGVHSPKFVHEADPAALAQAVDRYGVHHPVLDDPELVTWQAYTARAWPTLVLVDPEGYVVAEYAGEGHGHAIDALLRELAPVYAERGTLHPGGLPHAGPPEQDTALRFPARALALPGGNLLVADAGHGRLLETTADGEPVREIGPGALDQPQGLCLLPGGLGPDVVVADTRAHRLVGVDLSTGGTRALAEGLNSPWDVAWWAGRVWIAMAGNHTLATWDPTSGVVEQVAGTASEGLLDEQLEAAWFAQTSGLAPAGDRLWLVDAETSSLRWIEDGRVHTAVGEGLFDFGFRDGDREQARMQHPLGLTVAGDGSILVADTYNGAVRRFDPATGLLSTVASGLSEPVDALEADGRLLVVESGAHRVSEVLPEETTVEGPVSRTRRPPTELGTGRLALQVPFTPPPGQKVDERFGPATQLRVSATPPALIREGGGVAPGLERTLQLDPQVGEGVLHVSARAASCDTDGGEGAACRLHQQDWGIPVRLVEAGADRLVLPLGGPSPAETD